MKSDRRTSYARPLAAAFTFALASLSSSVGHAVPPEYMRSIVLHPSDSEVFALRYESAFGGLWFSRDGGHSLQIVPGQSFYKYDLRRFVPMTITGDGHLLLALDNGLRIDDGKGCGLDKTEPTLDGLWVADLAPHPSEPDTTFVITTGNTMGKHAGVWRRKGGTITALGMSEPAPTMPNRFPFIATGLRVVARPASTEGVRLIVVGTSYVYDDTHVGPDGGVMPTSTSSPVLRVSDNLGMTWTTHPITDPNKTGGNPRLLWVDGSADPFKALVFIENGFGEDSDDANDPIFVTKDGGQTFTPFLDKIQVAGEHAVMPDGKILLADRGTPGGLWSVANLDATPTKIAEFSVHCLAYQPKTQKLFMCKTNELGYYDLASGIFCETFRPGDTTSFVSCPDAPLDQNAAGIKQLCGGFCGAAHYSSAPLCSTFTPPAGTNLCGPPAHAYDNMSDDPDKRWVEPPGAASSPRCMGFSGPSAADAGVPAGDAGIGSANDAGAPSVTDAATSSDAGTSGGGGGPDAAVDRPKPKDGGCQLSVARGERSPAGALFAALALGLGRWLRRRRNARA